MSLQAQINSGGLPLTVPTPLSPVAGQLALSTYNIYACTNATGPVWKRTTLSSI